MPTKSLVHYYYNCENGNFYTGLINKNTKYTETHTHIYSPNLSKLSFYSCAILMKEI